MHGVQVNGVCIDRRIHKFPDFYGAIQRIFGDGIP